MKILIPIYNFGNLTGSELYVYDLARELVSRGHDVTIGRMSGSDGEIVTRTRKLGIKVSSLIFIKDKFDIIHSNQFQPTELASTLFRSPIVQTLHSEVNDRYETPFLHPLVNHYICIRKSIYDRALDVGIKKECLTLITNGVDKKRFKKTPLPKGETKYLFIGTKDYLREAAALDLVNSLKEDEKVTFIGKGWEIGEDLAHSQVRFIGERWNVEDEIKNASVIAGVLMGRSTIEGWLMGRKGLIYDINSEGKVLSKKLVSPPKDCKKFTSSYMVDQVLKVYAKIS